eukprot:9729268-Lingulodinium_polyedra.AAC.1
MEALPQQYTAEAVPHFRVKEADNRKDKEKEKKGPNEKKEKEEAGLCKVTLSVDPLHVHKVPGIEQQGYDLAVMMKMNA